MSLRLLTLRLSSKECVQPMAEYRLTPAAESDLEAIWSYSFEHWGEQQADRYVDVLTETFKALAQYPKTAPACDHVRRGYRRRNVESHVVYFQITTYGISIVRILHHRMDVARQL